MEICSSALRGLIVAPPGKKLVVSDLSNIEGRVLAWLAGETWKIKAFADFDRGIGHDLYNVTYAKAFGVPVETVTKDLRQIGKVMELAFGYQGGVGAWITFATAYNIDLEKMAEKALANIPGETIEQATRFFEWSKKQKKPTHGLSQDAFVMCDSFKRLWREGHPNVASYWTELQKTVMAAIINPGKTYIVGMHKIRVDGSWLRIGLPSGRCLCYPSPQIEDETISYMGQNQFTRKWDRLRTYGGKLAENITQAVARDVIAVGVMGAEKAGYEVILTVHDEILSETPISDEYSVAGLSKIMSTPAIWAKGLPLAAAGFESFRYKKED